MYPRRMSISHPRRLVVPALLLLVACGGSAKPAESAKPAGGDGTNAAGGADTASSPGGAAADAGPTTTTTATLGNGGDLQGAKLQSSNTTTSETTTSSGAKGGGHSSEPGRRPEDIATIIKSRRDEARKCYDDALKAHPGIEGDLDIRWKVDPKGVVTEIAADDAKSQIHEASVSNCIIAIIKKIKFAESQKGFETTMHYPFNFHPNQFSGHQ